MEWNADVDAMPRGEKVDGEFKPKIILAWLVGTDWPEAIYFDEYRDEDKIEFGCEGYWRYADDFLCSLDEIDLVKVKAWSERPEKPFKD